MVNLNQRGSRIIWDSLVVSIVPVGVRVPAVAATKMDVAMAPLHRMCPYDPKQDFSGIPAKDS